MLKKLIALSLVLLVCFSNSQGVIAMELTSSAFSNQAYIPSLYTCDGENISPPLAWRDFPPETKSFVLIVDDPDAPAGVWVHWLLFNIPSNVHQLQQKLTTLPAGSMQGANSYHKQVYHGPCPPSGVHRYYFRLYALDAVLPLTPGASRAQLESAMKNHVLAETTLMRRYKRK
jgi:Raf kinase inhibitor-like YbhB/YbcL family protein